MLYSADSEYVILLRYDTHMTSMKAVQFLRPPIPFVHSHPKFSTTPLTLDIKFQLNPPPSPNIFLFSTFHYQLINLVCFSLDFFSFSWSLTICFSWPYTLVCAAVQRYHEMSFLYTFLVLILQSVCFIYKIWKRKQTMEQQPHRACEQTTSKQKQNQVTSHSNWPRILLLDLAHKQVIVSLKYDFVVWHHSQKEYFLSIINLCLAQHYIGSWRNSNFL